MAGNTSQASTRLGSEQDVRAILGEPVEISRQKARPGLDHHCRDFIAQSPFLCLGTMDRAGRADVSPRGDPPGFVHVVDDRTLLIPDRPGNKRIDSMVNILDNPGVALLFLVPGIDETLRVNGRATIVRDPDLLAGMAVEGRIPTLAIRVEVHEVFFHCGKALKRARLWQRPEAAEAPTFAGLGRILVEQTATPNYTVEEAERLVAEDYEKDMY